MSGFPRVIVGGVPASAHPLYPTWRGMIRRCHNTTDSAYPLYGGRGIRVCDRWRNSFAAFIEDMGERPSLEHSIDRRENDEGYHPDNCRWGTDVEQANNKRPRPGHNEWRQPANTAALVRLREIVRAGLGIGALAKSLGVSQPSASKWLEGQTSPVHHYRLAIERLYGIPSTDWLTAPERLIAFGNSSQNEPFAVHANDAPSPVRAEG